MKKHSWFVALVVFTAISLFTPGCLTFEMPNPCPRTLGAEADASTNDTDASSEDVPNTETAPTSTEDRGSSPTNSPDASAPAEDRVLPVHPEDGIVTALLNPSTCHGRRLGGTTLAALGPFPVRHTLWHLCVKTPSRQTSSHTLATERATRLSLRLVDDGGTMNEILSAMPPATANPWTVSVLIALPIGQAPTFHARAEYGNGRSLALVETDPPTLHGEWRSWRVASDGTQTEESPTIACEDPLDTSNLTGVALPASVCSLANQRCDALRGYVCTNL